MTAHLPSAERIHALLEAHSIFRRIDVVDTTGSTNADLSRRAHHGEEEGAVLIAMEQTAGRGRLDRTWQSPPGASISMSLLLQPRPQFPQWGWLSLLAGMAVSSALTELAPDPARVSLKWPNDVLIGGKKVCGILSERIEQPDGARAVVGMGINIDFEADRLPVPQATSLNLEGITTDQSLVAATVLNHFTGYYRRWQYDGELRAEYEARCASVGAALKVVVDKERTVAGTGRGVDGFGRLQVATEAGVESFAVGDVIHARLG